MKWYRPGQQVEAEIEFQHVQVMREVYVSYEHTEDASAFPVVLSGEPWQEEELAGGVLSSRAQPTGMVGVENVPGIYRLTEIGFETFTGRRISIAVDDGIRGRLPLDTQAIRIIEDSDEYPRVRTLFIQ